MPSAKSSSYKVVGLLCEGREHNIFLAIQRGGDGRELVLKAPHPDRGRKDTAGCLTEEARLLALVSHPALPQVYPLAEYERGPALPMERIEGTLLRDLLLAGPLPPRAALDVVGALASALDAAHRAHDGGGVLVEVVHGGPTPDDVIIDQYGAVRLVGWSRCRSRLPRLGKRDESLQASPSARAPEVSTGGTVGPPADIFALGTLLVELLEGEQGPPLAVPPDKLDARRDEALSRLAGPSMDGLLGLVRELLATEPGNRPAADQVYARCVHISLGLPGDNLAMTCAARREVIDEEKPTPILDVWDRQPMPLDAKLDASAISGPRPLVFGAIFGAIFGLIIAGSLVASNLHMVSEDGALQDVLGAVDDDEDIDDFTPPAEAPREAPRPEPEPAEPEPAEDPVAAAPVDQVPAEPARMVSDEIAPPRPRPTTGAVAFFVRPTGVVGPSGEAAVPRLWRGDLSAGEHSFVVGDGKSDSHQVTVNVVAGTNNRFCWDARRATWCGGGPAPVQEEAADPLAIPVE